MEITQNVVHAAMAGGLETSYSSSSSSESHATSIEIWVPPHERTPLIPSAVTSARSSLDSSRHSSCAATPGIFTKECLTWRIIAPLFVFTVAMVMSIYLLWRQSSTSPDTGYKLNLIRHDIWSTAHLEGQVLLEAGDVVNVYITHTASVECSENCAQLLHVLQSQQLEELPFNFLLAGDCAAYEARGWRYASSWPKLPEDGVSLVLAFVGDFGQRLPSSCQLHTARALLWESQRRLKLQPSYELWALRNVSRSAWDADALQRELERWPHYAGQRQVK